MNKTELIAAIAEKAEISKKDSEKALKAFVDVVTEQLKNDDKVQLVGFGTFEVSKRAANSRALRDRKDNEDRSLQGSEVQSRKGFKGRYQLISDLKYRKKNGQALTMEAL